MLGAALLTCRVVLAGVFLIAGTAKLLDIAGSRRAVAAFGVPERLAGVAGVSLPLAELAVGVALVPVVSARFGALGAALLLLCFGAAIANALAHGRTPDCHCFGQVHGAPAGWPTLARNGVLLAVAGFVAVAGWQSTGTSATAWVTHVSGPWLVVIVAGLVIVALVSFQVWFSLQLLSQNGRALARLEALEAALAGVGGARGSSDNGRLDAGPIGAGLSGGGLPVGARAPEFELDAIDGRRYSLHSLLADGRPLMLMFSAAGCGPCEALLPDLARWQRQHHERLEIAVIASGDRERTAAVASEQGLSQVLWQDEREVSDAYGAYGTPMAVLIGADRVILTPTVGGSEAIGKLVAQATRAALAVARRAPSSNGHRTSVSPPPDVSTVGEPAPDPVLTSLDGQRVALKDLYRSRTLAIFWNPGCGFCQQMLPELRALEDDSPNGAPHLLVISAGDPDRVREQRLRSPVLLDPDGQAMRAFGAHGTPMAVLVDDQGRIASPVLAGAPAVLAAARGDPQPVPAGG